MNQRIKPCPFCGTAPSINRSVREYDAEAGHPAGEYDAWFSMQCDECGIEISEEYRSEAIKQWNRRGGKYDPADLEDEE